METVELSFNRPYKRIIEGRMLTCPRCKEKRDILQYPPLQVIEEFARDTTPPIKCPNCRWIFALADDIVLYVLNRTIEKNGDSKLAEN